jgi:glucans biosynthesis protein
MLTRRRFMAAASAALAAAGALPARAADELKLAAPQSFSHEALKRRAKDMASRPFLPPAIPSPEVINAIDYDAHGRIRLKPSYALFADGPGRFPVTFFHLGRWFPKPVHMHVVAAGQSREIVYEPSYFDMPADSPAHNLKENAGFAGFRFQESRLDDQEKRDWKKNDWVAFLGASYFRAIGELYQYGLSARGLAIDVTVAGVNEEFPDFTNIYFETPRNDANAVTVYALLEGPSVVGAYRFVMQRLAGIIMDVDAALFLRRDVSRFGIAPLTSMFWYSETAKPTAVDWRPEVHDSDGLAMWSGTGEHIWRPLNNPPRVTASAFVEQNPRGFGLLQRDRNQDHYHDGVYYERRPSLWVEALGQWGKGTVELIEIPTDDEIHDNIVAMWVPADRAAAGKSYDFSYRLHWLADEPYPSPLARCVATRLGNGGQPGQKRPKGVRKFMVEFLGGPLKDIAHGVKPEAVLSASRGSFSYVFTEAVPDDVPGHWRAQFDLTVTGADPVDIRCYLRNGDQVLSETWLYQYHPF